MRRLGVLLLACALLAGCGELFEPAAAVVHGEKITTDEVGETVDRFVESDRFKQLAQQGDPDGLRRQIEQELLTQLIRRAVLTPKAAELGIEITDEEVSERIEEIQSEFPSPGAFEETLKEQGLTLERLRPVVFDNMLSEELRAAVTEGAGPTEEELQDNYQQNQNDFRETEAQHILVAKQPLADDIAEQLARAPEAKVDALFARLAKRFSEDESNSDDAGDLGYFRTGDFVPEFEQAANQLEIGEISAPVRSEFGFHIIRVTDRRIAPFEDVRAEIETELAQSAQDKAWNDYVRTAYEEADVKVNPRYGEFDPETLAVVNASSQQIPGAREPSVTPAPLPTEAG